ncbi:MAG: hypothetical protein ACFCUM_09500 [Bacteroidales bacterium]
MKTFETDTILLRPLKLDDFEASPRQAGWFCVSIIELFLRIRTTNKIIHYNV